MQVDDEKELKEDSQDKKTGKEVLAENALYTKPKSDNWNANVLPEISYPGGKKANYQAGSGNSNKRARKARQTSGNTNGLKGRNSASGINVNSNNGSQASSLRLSKRCKRSKKSHPQTITAKRTPEKAVSFSVQTELLDHGDENMVTDLPSPLGKKENNNQDITLKKAGKSCKKIHVQNKIQHPVRSEKGNLDSLDSMQNVVGEVSKIQNQKNVDFLPHLSVLSAPTTDNDKTINFRNKPSTVSRKFESSDEEPRSKKKSRVSSVGNSKNDMANEILDGCKTHPNNLHTKETHAPENIQVSPDARALADPVLVKKFPSLTNDKVLQGCETTHASENIQDSPDARALADPVLVKKLPSLTNDKVLLRCETSLSKNQCAFCLSSEESEVIPYSLKYFFCHNFCYLTGSSLNIFFIYNPTIIICKNQITGYRRDSSLLQWQAHCCRSQWRVQGYTFTQELY